MTENKQNTIEKGYDGIYLERSGTEADELIEILQGAPECPLDDDQKKAVYSYEANLADTEIAGDSIEKIIKKAVGEDIQAPLFFSNAFLEGKIDLQGYNAPEFQSALDVYRWFTQEIQSGSILPDDARELAKQSLHIYKQTAANVLINGEPISPEVTDSMSLVLEPEKVLAYAAQVQATRDHLHEEMKEYPKQARGVEGGTRAVLEVYLARINEILAQYIPRVDYVIAQGILVQDAALLNEAVEVLPQNIRDAILNHRTHDQFLKRLDYLRNGIAVDTSGNASAIDERTLEGAADSGEVVENPPVYSELERKILQETTVEPARMQETIANILRKVGLLSSEPASTWSPTRTHRAHDNRFQVVINPGQATFAVDGTSGAYKVASEPRSVYDLLMVGTHHELTHINQTQADAALSKTLRIAGAKGKRVSMIREAGANIHQREAEQRYFGTKRPYASSYAHALQALEQGGNMSQAIQAYFHEKRRIDPRQNERSAALEASDRVVRLVRQGGFNSQPMVYAEEALLAEETKNLGSTEKTRATLFTSLDLVDQVKLHRYDLLPALPDESIDWSPYIDEALKPLIDEALQNAAQNV